VLKQEQQDIQTENMSEETPTEEMTTEAEAQTVEESENPSESAELQAAKTLAEENYQRYLRTQADFDNFRRRTLKEKEDLAKYASEKLLGQLVPVLDNFERALAANTAEGELDSFAKGVDMIYRQFKQVLEQEGVAAMNAVGQPFNPEFHQAVMQVETDEYEEGYVVEEMQKGYMLKDRVLRPAMVKVSG